MYFFDCREWLDTKSGTSRQLYKSTTNPKSNRARYKVTVKTSDIRGAGTDANVFIELLGEKGSTGRQFLDTSKDNFERSMVDTFFLNMPDVGTIQRCILGHDSSGPNPSWHCTSVEVVNTSSGQSAFFRCGSSLVDMRQLQEAKPGSGKYFLHARALMSLFASNRVNQWFDKDSGDKLTQRELRTHRVSVSSEPATDLSYDVSFMPVELAMLGQLAADYSGPTVHS